MPAATIYVAIQHIYTLEMKRLEMTQSLSLYQKYQYTPNDSWTWNYATTEDVKDLFDMAIIHSEFEVDGLFTMCHPSLLYALDLATSHQRHNLAHEQILTCRDNATNKLLAFSWIGRGNRAPYSRDEIAEARMAQVDLDLAVNTRIRLIVQMLSFWEQWAIACGVPILASNSIREKQQAYMKLHERLGFLVRGGIAYKRVIPKEASSV
jgi:hypothetical protein